MASDLKVRAKEAFVDDNFELAVELYSLALDASPDDADIYADRAQANIKLKNFTGAFPLSLFRIYSLILIFVRPEIFLFWVLTDF